MMGWNLRREVELLPPIELFPTLYHQLSMNIIVWNCRGALNPNFQSHCKVMVYKYVFCWLLLCAKFDCKFIQSFVSCIYCEI